MTVGHGWSSNYQRAVVGDAGVTDGVLTAGVNSSNLCTIQMVTRNYTYLQVAATRSLVGPDQLMTFTVLTCNDATLLLSENSTDQTNNIFEIVLGGWTNSKSVIRNATQGQALVSTSHSPLSCTATRAFYIRWDLNILRIGNLTGQSGAWTPASPFLTWNMTSTHKINYVFVASWDKPGNWTFAHSTTSDTKQCACGCKMVTSVNLSSSVLEESIRHLVGELKVQPKNTFAYSQRLNSAHDPRVSSGAIGIVGIVCMALPFGFIVCLDLVDLQRFLFQKSSRCCK
ncbi:hypothetical protein C0Q70_09971 [Pomacea canaliculata]|uniref:Farnesoic acid O-methyl transferase domain-containing protein n=1 Tax=Pomacea canaliculata TaxID=400727 RepID=A0A2T7PBA3_POMCA|nr:hypothetical protein C0Q70_09971 [Pomacea canaliculata]